MKYVLVSSFDCDPWGVAEAYTGAAWTVMLARRYPVVVAMREQWAARMEAYMATLDPAVASNITVLPVRVTLIGREPGRLVFRTGLANLLYELELIRLVRSRPDLLAGLGLTIRKVPVSFRYPTVLHRLGAPLVLGPLAGGIRPPAGMRELFRGEGLVYQLRYLDRLPMRLRVLSRHLDRASIILVSCDNVREILPARVQSKIRTILDTGVDISEFREASSRPDEFSALYVGRMVKYKAPVLAVEGFAKFVGLYQGSARLVMVGDGPELDSCRTAARVLGIGERVDFLGWLSREQTLAQYTTASAFVFPSLKEASGNVYLEAMGHGLPLVVVDRGGGRHIPPVAAAFKIAPDSREAVVDGIARSLMTLATDPGAARAMGAAGRAYTASHYSWAAIAEQVYPIVDECMDSSGQDTGVSGDDDA